MTRPLVWRGLAYLQLLLTAPFLLAPTLYQQSARDLAMASDTYLDALVPKGFSGAVLIAKDGKVILQEGYGMADRGAERPFTADTPFLIGSIGKQFTAAAILQLEMGGELSTGDPIDRFFPRVPSEKGAITLHQLLTHTAGLPQHHAGSDFEPLTREEALTAIFEAPLLFQPGQGYGYSDAGYVVLAAIVERVSGQPFTEYLRTNLFEPSGLHDTRFYDDVRWQTTPIAHGYYNGRDIGSPAEWPGPYWSLLGAGGVVSTVGDLFRWHGALQHNAVLSAEMREKLWTPYARVDGRTSYGYGWQISQTEYGGPLIWHVGAGRAHTAEFRYYPQRETVIIIGSNAIDDAYLGIGRLYETFHEVIYANEIGKTLSRNVLSGDFSLQPDLTLPGGLFIPLPEFVAAIVLAPLLAAILLRWRRKRRQAIERQNASMVQ